MSKCMKSVLYITYDGLLEPLGQSQVLSYLNKLSINYRIYLLSFEKKKDWDDFELRNGISKDIEYAGINWYPLRYHKNQRILATTYDIIHGIIIAVWIASRKKISLVHARGDVSSVIALFMKKLFKLKYLYDIRGFWPDERVDGGIWAKDSLIYRVSKFFEKRFMLAADYKVVLTKAAVRELHKLPYLQGHVEPLSVITTCTDLVKFQPQDYSKTGFTLGYVGSVGTWYLFDEVLKCFMTLKRINSAARLLIINRNEHLYIFGRIRAMGLNESDVEVKATTHDCVPREMARMDAGIFIIKPLISKRSSAPTKLGEFLGCGVPCLGNTGVGDVAEVLERERVGVAIDKFDEDSREKVVRRLLELTQDPEIRYRCEQIAKRYFSLGKGVLAYADIYHKLTSAR